MSISKFNPEGYHDPTAYEALTAVRRSEQEAERRKYPRTYICSPFKGNTVRNTANAVRYCRFALDQERMPIAPHLLFPQFMNDTDPEERELGISFGLRLLAGCSEVWVFGGNISRGMRREIEKAVHKGIPVRYFNESCEEVSRCTNR
jgi:hypothetical protein